MADEIMYIPNDYTQITPYIDYNQQQKRFDIQLNDQPIKIQLKSSKFKLGVQAFQPLICKLQKG